MKIELSVQEIRAIIGSLDSQQVRLGRIPKVDQLIERLEGVLK